VCISNNFPAGNYLFYAWQYPLAIPYLIDFSKCCKHTRRFLLHLLFRRQTAHYHYARWTLEPQQCNVCLFIMKSCCCYKVGTMTGQPNYFWSIFSFRFNKCTGGTSSTWTHTGNREAHWKMDQFN